jgi:hypothetical protein
LLSNIIEFIVGNVLTIGVRAVADLPWCSQKSYIPIAKAMLKLSQAICLVIEVPNISVVILFSVGAAVVIVYIYF